MSIMKCNDSYPSVKGFFTSLKLACLIVMPAFMIVASVHQTPCYGASQAKKEIKKEIEEAIHVLHKLHEAERHYYKENGQYLRVGSQCFDQESYKILHVKLPECSPENWIYNVSTKAGVIKLTSSGQACSFDPGSAIAIKLGAVGKPRGTIVKRSDETLCGSDDFAPGKPYDLTQYHHGKK